MSARDVILARVRAANAAAGVTPTPRPPLESASGAVAAHGGSDDALVDLLVDRLVDYRAEVHVVAEAEVADQVLAALAAHQARSVIAPAGLPPAWLAAFDGSVVTDDDLSPHDLDALDAVVTTSAVAIAETGTIILDHGAGQGRRALTLVPDIHVCVVRAADLVPDVPDAVRVLRPRMLDGAPPLTWISGPSATSDIELNRVEGVHGPRQLVVLVVT